MNLVVQVACVALLTLSCNKEPAPSGALLSDEDRALLEKVKAKEKSRTELEASPAKFIQAGQWKSYDKGVFNTYTVATDVEFTNLSQFDVSDIQGSITYINEGGSDLATVPFKAQGDLDAGKKAMLKVTATEISGGAKRARIVVQHVKVRNG